MMSNEITATTNTSVNVAAQTNLLKKPTKTKLLACSDLKGTSQQFSNKVPRDNSCVYLYIFHIFIDFLVRIGSDHNFRIFFKTTYKRLQAVRSVASSGKSYQLPPDKGNTV